MDMKTGMLSDPESDRGSRAVVETERANPADDKTSRLYRFTYVLILTLVVAGAYLFLIGDFLIDIFLSVIFAGLLHPVLEKSLPRFGGRRDIAAAAIVIAAILIVALPLAAIVSVVWSEGVQIGDSAVTWLQQMIAHPESLLTLLPKRLAENPAVRTAISSLGANAGGIINELAMVLSRWISSTAVATARFFLDLFVTALALAYFLQDGPMLSRRIMERIPVANAEARVITDKTVAITAATLKSILIIGADQGFLIGTGFAVAGIGHPWFWGTLAAVASTVPGLGSGLVWIPGAIYLASTGHVAAALGLAAWGIASVSIGDTLLRTYIVGRGAAMPGFIVFISTLGGLTVLGPPGLLIGPVLAGALLGVLDLYRAVLRSSGLANNPAQDE